MKLLEAGQYLKIHVRDLARSVKRLGNNLWIQHSQWFVKVLEAVTTSLVIQLTSGHVEILALFEHVAIHLVICLVFHCLIILLRRA